MEVAVLLLVDVAAIVVAVVVKILDSDIERGAVFGSCAYNEVRRFVVLDKETKHNVTAVWVKNSTGHVFAMDAAMIKKEFYLIQSADGD